MVVDTGIQSVKDTAEVPKGLDDVPPVISERSGPPFREKRLTSSSDVREAVSLLTALLGLNASRRSNSWRA